eukprot:jgi/Galph1/4027/GphlegSOOS_G2710.1
MTDSKHDWNVHCSKRAKETFNPIRDFVQNMNIQPNPNKSLIRLSVGDPTEYGNLPVPEQAVKQLSQNILSGKYNNYTMSFGLLDARKAIAERFSTPSHSLQPEQVLLTCGTAGAIELTLSALGDEGKVVLIPQPGFPLFQTIAKSLGMKTKSYRLIPDNNWEIDLKHLTSLVDNETVAIIVNNPSNPCGSVYSKVHLQAIVSVANECKLPIIADEVYADLCFENNVFHPLGSISENVPVLSLGSISKIFAAPGWRLGWVIIHDRQDILSNSGVIAALHQLTMRMFIPSTPIQSAIPVLFSEACRKGQQQIKEELQRNALIAYELIKDISGLGCRKPQGALYLFVEIDLSQLDFTNEVEFSRMLLKEESVFVIPGSCFGWPSAFRIVLNAPEPILKEACHRLRHFCKCHRRLPIE